MYTHEGNINEIIDNREDRACNEHPLLPNEASRIGNGLHLVKFLAKEVLWELSNYPGCCQDYRFLSIE